MASAAVGGFTFPSFSVPTVKSGRNNSVVSACFGEMSSRGQALTFQQSVSRNLQIASLRSPPRQSALQVWAAIGYPVSMRWWKKGNRPNIREINSAEEFKDSLTKAGDKLVLVDFFSTGCRSCKAMHPKVCQIAADNPEIEVLKVEFYDNNPLCRSLNVNILPFYHFYRGAEGRVDAFSCSLSKVQKLREAVAKHKRGRVQSKGPSVAQNDIRSDLSTHTLVAAGSAS